MSDKPAPMSEAEMKALIGRTFSEPATPLGTVPVSAETYRLFQEALAAPSLSADDRPPDL